VTASPVRTLVGGLGYRWQGDGSFGLTVTDALAQLPLGPAVVIADLGYGAIYAAQDIAAAAPERLILIAAVERGEAPGTIRRYRYDRPLPPDDEILARVREAGAGVIDLDHLLVIAQQMQMLPAEVVVIEVEPLDTTTATELTPLLQARVDEVVELVRAALAPLALEPA
jgi:hydrogenase maturation protease